MDFFVSALGLVILLPVFFMLGLVGLCLIIFASAVLVDAILALLRRVFRW